MYITKVPPIELLFTNYLYCVLSFNFHGVILLCYYGDFLFRIQLIHYILFVINENKNLLAYFDISPPAPLADSMLKFVLLRPLWHATYFKMSLSISFGKIRNGRTELLEIYMTYM